MPFPRQLVFLLFGLSLVGCEKREASEQVDEAGVVGTTIAPFDGLEIALNDGITVGGTPVVDEDKPALAVAVPGKDDRFLPAVAEAASAAASRERAARGVLVRVHPAVPSGRLNQLLFTLREVGLPLTHFALGDGQPARLGDAGSDSGAMYVTINARGMTVTVGDHVVPAIAGCPPGPTLCLDGELPVQARGKQAHDKLRGNDLVGAVADVREIAAAYRFDELTQRVAAGRAALPAAQRLAVAAHPFVPVGVVYQALTTNCVVGNELASCDRHFDTVALTILR